VAVAAAVDTVAVAEVAAAVDIVVAAEVAEAVDTVVAAVAAAIVTVAQPLPPYRRTVRPRRLPVTARQRNPAHRSRAKVADRSHGRFPSR
jgi:hypothetical protein